MDTCKLALARLAVILVPHQRPQFLQFTRLIRWKSGKGGHEVSASQHLS